MPHRLQTRQPSILFISFVAMPGNFRVNPSVLYRCLNLGAALSQRGFRVEYRHALQAVKQLMLTHHDVCVLHRPNGSHLCRVIGAMLRKKGVHTIIDYDDLIFDPRMHKYSSGVIHGHVSPKELIKRFTRSRDFSFRQRHFTVSTEALADVLQQMHPQAEIRVIHNACLAGWRQTAQQTPARERRLLTYFPGTRGHEHDLAVAWPAIREVLRQREDIEFRLVGCMDVRELRRDIPVSHRELLPPEEYRHEVAASWVNIGPLADNPFNRCKSALKMIEASAFGVPTVYSPIEDARRFEGKGCLLADSHEAWVEQLLALTEEDFYRQQQALAFDAGQHESDIDPQVERFIGLLAEIGV